MIDLFENLRLLFNEALPQIDRCTCQIFSEENQEFKPCASGVFIELEEKWFLFTAAHVFDNENEILWVRMGSKKFIKLQGNITVNEVINRKNDNIDLGIMELYSQTINYLKESFIPITKNELGINSEIKLLPDYLVFGYPVTKSKVNSFKNTIKISPFVYNTIPAVEDIYSKLQYDKAQNILLKYDKKNFYNYESNSFSVGPDPYGISGGGVWHVAMNINPESITPVIKLVSILTDWSIKNKKYWISTRIDIFTETLRKNYGLSIPHSNIITV